MKITLRPVDAAHRQEIAALTVRPDQERLVTSPAESLQEADAYLAAGGWACPLGIYDGETPVGFAMVGYQADPCGPNGPQSLGGSSYEIVRFLVDRRYQGRGVGSAAFPLLVQYLRTLPAGPARYCWISYKPDNTGAEALYLANGFLRTRLTNYDETVAVLPL